VKRMDDFSIPIQLSAWNEDILWWDATTTITITQNLLKWHVGKCEYCTIQCSSWKEMLKMKSGRYKQGGQMILSLNYFIKFTSWDWKQSQEGHRTVFLFAIMKKESIIACTKDKNMYIKDESKKRVHHPTRGKSM